MAERTATATDPRTGVVHEIMRHNDGSAWVTMCGLNADGWSQAVTVAQNLGMVLFCEACRG